MAPRMIDPNTRDRHRNSGNPEPRPLRKMQDPNAFRAIGALQLSIAM